MERPFRGVRSVGLDLSKLQARCQGYAARMPRAQLFSHVTAARLMDLPLPLTLGRRRELDVAAAVPARAPQVDGIIGHQFSPQGGGARTHRGVRITSPELTWIALATVLDLDDLVAVGDALVTGDHAWTSIDALAKAIVPGVRGARVLRTALGLIRPGALSRPETHLRLAILRAGYPEPTVAYGVRLSRSGRLLHPDLSWPQYRVAFEYEGDQHRTDRWQFRHDIDRVESLVDDGWTVSRFTADDVYLRLARTMTRVDLRLRAHGWSR